MAEKLVQLKKKGGGGGSITSITTPAEQEHFYQGSTWLTKTFTDPIIGLVAYPQTANSDYVTATIVAAWWEKEGYNVIKQSNYVNRSGSNGYLQIKVIDAHTVQYRITGDDNYINRYGAYANFVPIY